MGTLLQARGLKAGEEPERWNIARPQLVKEVHLAYLEAGCDIIASNTFGATRAHLGEDADALMTAGVKVAMEAVREAGHGWVAADISSLGRLLQPYGDMPFEEAVQQFREAAQAGLTAGADLVLIETMTDLLELKAAVLGAREAMEAVGLQVPLFCRAAFEGKRRLLTGADIRGTAAMLVGLGADAVGLNCGLGPKDLLEHTRELLRWCEKPVFISPNAGVPVVASCHAATLEQLGRRPQVRRLLKAGALERVVLLEGERLGEIQAVYEVGDVDDQAAWRGADRARERRSGLLEFA